MSNMIEKELCHVNDMPDNSMKEFDIQIDDSTTTQVLLVKNKGEFSCLASRCTHYGVPLKMGVLNNGRLRCFAHGACFDVKTGDIEDFPGPDSLPVYDIYIKNDMVYLKASKEELAIKKRLKSIKTFKKKGNTIESDRSCNSSAPTNIETVPLTTTTTTSSTTTTTKTDTTKDDTTSKTTQTSTTTTTTSNSNQILVKQMNSESPKCLIIGSGAAGLVCMDTLRANGFNSNITVLTDESNLPIDRPKLSKKMDITHENIILRDDEYFKKHNIDYKMNEKVEKIEFTKKQVFCKSGEIFDYDKLVIATGLRALSMPETPGINNKGVFTLRNLNDSQNITNYFQELNKQGNKDELNVIIMGGSFISLETASYFIENKAKTLIMGRSKPFEKSFGTQVSNKIIQLHESNGVKFYNNKNMAVKCFRDSKATQPAILSEIELENGDIFPCDLCLLAVGAIPCTEFIQNSDLELNCRNLVVVNENMKSNVDGVYAAGDITSFPRKCILPGLGFDVHNKNDDLINIGHWAFASSQGKCAALSIINEVNSENHDNKLKVVPFFWSTQFGENVRFSGFNDKYDSIIFHQTKGEFKSDKFKFAAFYIESNQVIGVCTLTWDPMCALFAEILFAGIEVNKGHIQNDPLNSLKKLLKDNN